MSTRKILMICAGILLIAAAVTFLIFMTEPSVSPEGATRETAMLVDVVQVQRGDYQPVIVATGNVQPVEDVMISAQVGGQVIHRTPEFLPGGFIEKGQILLQIDPADYRNTLELRKSELLQSETDLDVEMGRQEVAQQDLELVGVDTLSTEHRSLVLRQPQLNAVRATVKAADAAVNQAELELSRTTIRAPFDAHILMQNVTVGSQVAPGDDLGRLVGTENYWVTLTVPVSKLQWLTFPHSDEEKGSPVKIRSNTAWPEGIFREGYLNKQVGALDDQTRLARVLVKIPDPLAQEPENEGLPPLIIGGFVEAQVQGREIEDVVRLNRDYLRSNQTVWVMQEGKLSIRDVDIVLTDSEYAYIREGLKDQEQVVVTNLSTVAEGISLRTESGEEERQDTEE